MTWSDEQKKDWKLRLSLLGLAVIIATPFMTLGPLLPRVGSHYATNAKDEGAPKRLLQVALIQANTMRPKEAEKTLERFFELFADEDAYDFREVVAGEGEWKVHKHWPEGLQDEGFTPWLFPEGKDPSAVVQAADSETLALALDAYGELLEDRKEYPQTSHVYTCLANMWPENSEGQLLGEAGVKRALVRTY